jgi:hypothetical protein
MSLILANWKLIVMGLLLVAVGSFYHLWRSEVDDFTSYKALVTAEGNVAKIEAQRVNDLQKKQLEESTNEWNKQLPKIRAGAVAAYIARYGVQQHTSSGAVPGQAASTQGSDGTSQGGVAAASTCDPGFVSDAAEDAGKVGAWQAWASGNGLPVQ